MGKGQKSKISKCSLAEEENQLKFTASKMENMRLSLQGEITGAQPLLTCHPGLQTALAPQ